MRKFLAVTAFAVLPVAALAAPESYTLDPYHTYPNFTVDHLGVSTMHGQFQKSSGKVTIDRAAKTGSIDLTIDAASITTGDVDKTGGRRTRDEHLRTPDFFNVAEFPKVTFKSNHFTFTGDNPSGISGDLTIIGVTKPVQLTIDRFKCNPAQGSGKERCGGNASGKFKRSDFGMKYGVPNIGDEITLLVEFEATKD